MQQYILRRLLLMIPTLFVITIFTFGLLRIMPGDFIVAQMAEARGADLEQMELWRAELGLDEPAYKQYVSWVRGLVVGDWGTSYWRNEPVTTVIREALPISFELGALSIVVAVVISLPIGILSAIKQDTWIDYLARSISIAGISIPNFFLALLVIIYGSKWFGWFPPQTYQNPFENPMGNLEQFIPGAFVLGAALSAQNMRMLRTTMLETLRADYVRTARAKGLKEWSVIYRHAFRNALIPVVTLLGLQITVAIGGSVIIETVMNMNGVGRNYIAAVQQRDYPLVQGILLVLVSATLLTNLMVDLSYSWLDPRIRY
ncbi:MAG: ABC transporter permease [Dehalococcoidia bacterium]|jgi:peptide/nickel transport system permease protein|nr:ABC transporter permease [Dehalococcoidia bacterium]